MWIFKKGLFGIAALVLGQMAVGQGVAGKVAKQRLLVTGNVGASASFYSSDETVKTRPSFAWSTNGNMLGRVGKWRLPFSYVVTQYSNSHVSPHVQIGISPTYEWARFHIGYRYIPFSALTFEGQSFRGAGVELFPKGFRFAAFYGRLNKAVNEDTSNGRFKVPQFSRKGYGLKIGIGDATRFLDLIYFHAKDDSSSASIVRGNTRRYLYAQENAVVGSAFKLTIAKRWIWSGDAAISGLIHDLSGKTKPDSADQSLKKFISRFLPGSGNISSHYAAQSSVAFFSRGYSGNAGYRRVQPGFKSLGTPYMIDDVELLSLVNNLMLAKGKLNIGTNYSQQHNNLSKSLEAELRTQVANVYVNTILGQHFSINLNASGYNLKQRNDRNNLPDSLRINDTLLLRQQISQYSVMPNYNLTKGNNIHYLSANLTVQKLNDKNGSTAARNNSRNLSTSLTYTLAFLSRPYSFSANYLHSQYKQSANDYTSNGGTLSASAQLLKNRRWNLQGSFGFFSNKFNSLLGTQKNTSYALNSGYQGRHNAINVFVNYIYTPPNNAISEAIRKAIPYAIASKYMYGGLTYSHSF